MTTQPTLIARRTFRTGVQSLWRFPDGRWFVGLDNRTNRTRIEIPADKAPIWKELLR